MSTRQPERDMLQVITAWARARSAIRAVLLTSTRAIPNGRVDALSDYDVILVVEDIHPFADDRAWITDFGDILVVYWDPVQPDPDFGIDYIANVTQYADGLKIDFTLWSVDMFQQIVAAPTLLAELDAGYLVLLDKDHLTDYAARAHRHRIYSGAPNRYRISDLDQRFLERSALCRQMPLARRAAAGQVVPG